MTFWKAPKVPPALVTSLVDSAVDSSIGDAVDSVIDSAVDSVVGKGIFLTGDHTLYDDLQVPGFAVRTSGSSPPDFDANFVGDASMYSYRFDGTNTMEEVFFDVQMPHCWKEGSTIYPHVHFSPTSTNSADAVSRTVRFVLEYTWCNVAATFGATAEYEMTKAFIPNTSLWAHLIASGAGLAATDKTLSSIIKCRLYRDPANAGDTYPQDVAFLSVDFHYEIDSLGSATEYGKTA